MTTTTVPPEATATPDLASRVFLSPSASHPGVTHTLCIAESTAGTLIVRCDCPAGTFPHRKPIPCRHARAVVDLLDDLGAVEPSPAGLRLTCPPSTVWADLELLASEQPAAESQWAVGYQSGWAAAVDYLTELLELCPTADIPTLLASNTTPWPSAAEAA